MTFAARVARIRMERAEERYLETSGFQSSEEGWNAASQAAEDLVRARWDFGVEAQRDTE